MRDFRNQNEEKRRTDRTLQIRLFILLFFALFSLPSFAQNYLSTLVSIDAKEERLDSLLAQISRIGGFYFSYSSDALPKDSLVSMSVRQEPVEKILNMLLKGDYEYKETPNYVILRLAPNRLQLVSEDNHEYGKIHTITGHVIDDVTGERIAHASVYEKRLLLSTLTDKNGYFSLKVKNPVTSLSITVSKEYYRDTTVVLLAPVLVGKSDQNYGYHAGSDLNAAERTGVGRFLVSSKQKLQSLNLGGFFANSPVQTSLTPGLSTHGSLSGQVVPKVSINMIGGYTFGVEGVELGGAFNINKSDVRVVQAAGIFNLVGGGMRGVQLAGISNTVMDSVIGLQASGLYNHNLKNVKGVLMSGGINLVHGNVDGVQIAGLANITHGEVQGSQFGAFNYAKKISGLQVGLVNIADTSSGVSIGLLNFIKGGYHRLSVSNNEFTHVNVEYQSGVAGFYTVLKVGMSVVSNQKMFLLGGGFGRDFLFNDHFSLGSQLTSQNAYLGNWNELSNLYRAKLVANFRLSKNLEIYAGPALNVFVDDRSEEVARYKNHFPFQNYDGKRFNAKTNAWIGWDVGVTLF